MAQPIRGPFANDWAYGPSDSRDIFWKQARYRQAKPYNIPAPYYLQRWKTLRKDSWGDNVPAFYPSTTSASTAKSLWFLYAYEWNPDVPEVVLATNKARGRFSERIGPSVQAAVAMAEMKSTVTMVASRVEQFLSFVRAVSRGRLGDAYRELGLTGAGSRDRRNRARQGADAILETNFGWKPLLQDIHDGIDTLQQEIPLKRIRTSAVEPVSWTARGVVDLWDYIAVHSGRARCRIQADVRVDNPNLYLASRMGLLNPAEVVWEKIPFSFLVDWWVNVSDVLHTWSDLYGLEIRNPQCTFSVHASCDATVSPRMPPGHPYYSGYRCVSDVVYVERQLRIPSVRLVFQPMHRLSFSRGSSAAALVVQQLYRLQNRKG